MLIHGIDVPGPWDDEIDQHRWVDEATGLDCAIVRGPLGAWCGYVGVDATHPEWGAPYQDVEADVHGGLTWSHGYLPGEQLDLVDGVWWFGFDCSHFNDLIPGMIAMAKLTEHRMPMAGDESLPWSKETYRDVAYVTIEVCGLAEQLAS